MDYQIKHGIKKALEILLFMSIILIVVAILIWSCIFVTDYIRCSQNNLPLFVISSTKDGTIDGYTIVHQCLLYKYVELYKENQLTTELYLLNFKIK